MADETILGPKGIIVGVLTAVFTAVGFAWKTVRGRARDSGHAAVDSDVAERLEDFKRRLVRDWGGRLATLEAEVSAIREELARDNVEKREILEQLKHVSAMLMQLSRDFRIYMMGEPPQRQQAPDVNR